MSDNPTNAEVANEALVLLSRALSGFVRMGTPNIGGALDTLGGYLKDVRRRLANTRKERDEMRACLEALVEMYVANPHCERGEFISCITPKHACEMKDKERKEHKIWRVWDRARHLLGEKLPGRLGSKPL